jgi:ATP-dependent DNA ligase
LRLEGVASLISPRCHVPGCVYCFDLLELHRDDQPLMQRRAQLSALLGRAKSNPLRFGESFPDAQVLLANALGAVLRGSDG